MIDAALMIAGEAGQGVQSIGFILSKLFARGGYHVYSDQDYESRVRGGHNFFRIRVTGEEVGAISETLDVLLALNQESVDLHRGELGPEGLIIFDRGAASDVEGERLVDVPLGELAQQVAGSSIMANTVALGACLALLGYEPGTAEVLLEEIFGSKHAEANVKALHAGFNHVAKHASRKPRIELKTRDKRQALLLNGNEALALGALAAGCRFVSAYPMTPASSILEYMASKARELDMVVVQPEDEIAAIHMAIGAGYAGVRSMTATSGSGFCLMVEGLGLAGITETPLVVVDAQRPGPAVGLPTRTEQGDLQFVLNAHHGDFPRAILAPSTAEEAFYLTFKAFNLAEKYQTPVIVLTDHLLATSYQTVSPFDFRRTRIHRGELYESARMGGGETYMRHSLTPSGISPRAFPGLDEALVVTDGDEHGEDGHPIEAAGIRSSQMEKRMRKMDGLRGEIGLPFTYGAAKPELTFVSWGSTYGAVREAVDSLNSEDMQVDMVHLSELWPFPREAIAAALNRGQQCYSVEGNATGQMARLIRAETGVVPTGMMLKYDGRPFTSAYIVRRVKQGDVSPW